jgi:RIP metalloprotease RseP
VSDTEIRPASATATVDPPEAEEASRDLGYGSYSQWASQWGNDRQVQGPRRWLGLLGLLAVLGLLWYFGGVTMVVVVLALILSIVLHELGHFLTAKKAGMKCTEFFIGFGPRIWSTRRGETEYGIKAIPAGAYVRIIGMNSLEEVDPRDEDHTYRSKPYLSRLAVILAGPFMNILLGFVIFIAVFATIGVSDPSQWTIGQVSPGSAAAAAGLQPGDRIASIDGQSIGDFSAMRGILDSRAGEPSSVVIVDADGSTTTKTIPLGWRLNDAGAAAIPGMQANDNILQINPDGTFSDDNIYRGSYQDFANLLAQNGPPLEFHFQRGNYVYSDVVNRPIHLPASGAAGFFGVTGINPEPVRQGPLGAVAQAGSAVGNIVTTSGQAIGHLFSPTGLQNYAGTVANSVAPTPDYPKALHAAAGYDPSVTPSTDLTDRPMSIVGAVRATSDVAKTSIADALSMLAVINISLGLLNLLPFLPLDGGHAAVATYEAIRSRKGKPYRVNAMKLLPVTYAFVAVLLLFGLSTIFLDIKSPITP